MTTPTAPTTTPVLDAARAPELTSAGTGGDPAEVSRGLFELIRPPERRATTGILLFAFLVSAICWYFGADVWHSILIGIGLTTVGVSGSVATAVLDLGGTDWRGDERPNRNGARRDIAELSGFLRGSYGRVRARAAWRVTSIARQRLAAHQLELRDPADRREIERLIGRRAYLILVRGERRPPLLRSLRYCLDVLDGLDRARPTAAPQSRSRRRTPIFPRHRRRSVRGR